MEKKHFAVFLMIVCTVFISIAQIFYKLGAARLPDLLTNYNLFLGLFLYALAALILVTALKLGEVTVLYPIIATSYIWVSLLSWLVFSESINIYKWAGIAAIFAGITVIAFGSKETESVKYVEGL